MSKTAQAIEEIQKDFMERFGVAVEIDINIHRADNKQLNQGIAEYITRQMEPEIKSKTRHCEDGGTAWYTTESPGSKVEVTVFYDPEQ